METGPLSHYHYGIGNLERSHIEVPDTADNADRASIMHDSYWP